MGKFSVSAIAIQNFPEGMATFISALTDPSIAIPIAVAIALHNIPEGISVSVPICYATGSKRKALLLSFLSGVAEPAGALIGCGILRPFISPVVFGLSFAVVAGIMVFISMDELFPTAKEYGKGHAAVHGLVPGMAVIPVSLLLFM
jgi:ZIP family zinc transporter